MPALASLLEVLMVSCDCYAPLQVHHLLNAHDEDDDDDDDDGDGDLL